MGNDVSTPTNDSEESKSSSMVGNIQSKLTNFANTNFSQDLQAKTREYAEKLHLTKSKSANPATLGGGCTEESKRKGILKKG